MSPCIKEQTEKNHGINFGLFVYLHMKCMERIALFVGKAGKTWKIVGIENIWPLVTFKKMNIIHNSPGKLLRFKRMSPVLLYVFRSEKKRHNFVNIHLSEMDLQIILSKERSRKKMCEKSMKRVSSFLQNFTVIIIFNHHHHRHHHDCSWFFIIQSISIESLMTKCKSTPIHTQHGFKRDAH